MGKDFVVCDLETTGLSPLGDDIVEIGLVKIQKGKITDTYTTLVKHNKPLPLRISRITGLKEGDFIDSPSLDLVMPKVLSFIGDFPLIGHNVKFDADFLNANLSDELQNTLLDTLELSRLLYPMANSYRLGKMCEEVGVETKPSHRALEDAIATAELFLKLTDKLNKFDLHFMLQLSSLIKMADTGWKDYITEVAQEKALNFSNEKISGRSFFADTENDADDTDDNNVECHHSVEDILGRDGVLSKRFDNYEYRPHQLRASRAIEDAFAGSKHLVVEAGTGVGKSFAYLVPAILWSLGNKERVLISTQTINLQEQLYKKDLPQLRKVLEIPFKAALMKGRRNYLCLRRWQQAMNSNELSPKEAFFTARVLIWLRNTKTGDKAELNMAFEEPERWDQVRTDSESCTGSKCSWFYNGCYLSRARKKAEQSNLVIVNHSLLFSNLSAESRILPSYNTLVVDEAHHLEDAATDYLGKEVSSKSFANLLTRTERYFKRLGRIFVGSDGSKWVETLRNAQNLTGMAREALVSFFNLLTRFVNTYSPGMAAGLKWQTLRLNTPDCLQKDAWRAIESEKHNLCLRLQNLHETMISLLDIMGRWDEQTGKDEELADELGSLARLVLQHLYDFQFILDQNENFVSWAGTIRQSSKVNYCYLKASPIDVSELLYKELFQTHGSIILTSATMTVDSSFDFFNERTGIKSIDTAKYESLQVGSPFSLENQVLFCVARDITIPGPGGGSEYHSALADAIITIADVTKGRTMVLFTSHRSLQTVYHEVLPELNKKDIILLGQGIDGGRNALIQEFKTSSRAVLFGAASFWEGVDLPGDFLKCVIIVRLPFQPPSIPIVEARLEKLVSQGSNAFRKLTLPHAVLKFKQGFGRLIRSSTDTGTVVVLDSRLVEKNYGSYFIRSLGIKKYYNGSIEKIAQQVDGWVNNC